MSFEKGGDMEEMVEIDIIPEMSDIDKLKAQIAWLWSAIDEIWESMPQEPEPPERDEP